MLSAETPSTRYDFTYYENGLRKTKQCVQGYQSYEYIYDGTTLVTENFIGLYTLVYIYDVNGAPIGFKYRANNYATDTWDVFWYEKNLLGDIVAVYSATGTKLVSYDYDAWGNFTTTYHNGGASTGAMYNKFTYRGYYYDSDLGMYYLQSRYYDPVICRFINADIPDVITATPTALTDKNLYAYCDNNPVMRTDESGEFWNYVIGTVVGGIIGGYLGYLTAKETGSDITSAIITGAILGATSGAIVSSGNAKMISGGISGVLSKTTTDVISASYGSAIGTWEDYATAFIFGSISSIVDNGTKTVLDVAVRPAFNQIVKMHTRGKEFDEQKYAYDVVTRGLTSGGTRSVLQATFGGQVIKVDLGKCFFRATLRKVYSYFNGG